RRPSRACSGLLSLPESDGRGAAGRHGAANSGREVECGSGADLGAVLLLPEEILQRQRPPSFQAKRANALRFGSFRVSVKPCWPPGVAWTDGSGLSALRANRSVAYLGFADLALGQVTRSVGGLCPLGVGTGSEIEGNSEL